MQRLKYITVNSFLLLIGISSCAQPKTKKVLVEGTGPVIVMLHGGTADMNVFTEHSRQLSANYKVIRMQQFNTAYAEDGTKLPKNYSVKMESAAIKATLNALKINEPIILVGHSYGGVIAFDFAINYSQQIKALVLVEPPLFSLAKEKKESYEGMTEMMKLTEHLTPDADITEETVKQFRCGLMNCDTFDIQTHPLWASWVKHKYRLRGLSAVNEYQTNIQKVRDFQKPVLVVTGTSTVEFHKQIDILLSKEFPNASAASLPGGHTAINSKPDDFVKVLLSFLNSHLP